jgi:hypothetical protein
LFLLDGFLKITEVAQNFWLLFWTVTVNFEKIRTGLHFGWHF